MSKFKVPHNSNGDHNPLESMETAMLTDPYELTGVTLKYISQEVNRASVHICWEDIFTGRRYRSDYKLLQDLLTGAIDKESHVSILEERGLYITGNFGFEQYGNHVLLTSLSPNHSTVDKDLLVNAAKEIFEAILSGRLNLRQVKTEAKGFLKYINAGKEAGQGGNNCK